MKKQSIIGNKDIDSGETVLTDDPTQAAEFWKDVHQSESWQRYLDEFGNTSENNDIVIGIVEKLYGDYEFTTTGFFIDALDVAMNAGELQSLPQEDPEQESIPTDKNGRKLSPQQIRWSEYTKFANEHSSQECKARSREDSGFASFIRTNLRREMNEQGVGDAATNLNDRPQSNDRVIPELARWVEEYRLMPIAEVRRRSRADTNPSGYEHFNKMMDLACKGGLI